MITIYGTLRSVKNHRQIVPLKKPRITKSGKEQRFMLIKGKAALEQEDALQLQVQAAKGRFFEMIEGKEFPIRISFKLYRPTKHRFDYVNCIQGILDQMVKCGLVPDDSADYVIPHFEPYEIDKINPRTEIVIL